MTDDNKRRFKTSDAQLEASRKYREKDPENFKRIDYKSKAKVFTKQYAEDDEMFSFLKTYVLKRKKNKREAKVFFKKIIDYYVKNYADNEDLIEMIQLYNEKNRDTNQKDVLSFIK